MRSYDSSKNATARRGFGPINTPWGKANSCAFTGIGLDHGDFAGSPVALSSTSGWRRCIHQIFASSQADGIIAEVMERFHWLTCDEPPAKDRLPPPMDQPAFPKLV